MRIFIWKNGRVSAQTKASLCTVDQTILLLLSAQLFRFNYLSRYFFLLPCVDFCFPIVPMRISILCRYQKILGSKSTWHSLELLPQMILFIIIMYAPPPPNDPINHPSDTVYLFYVFLLWVMEEHLFRSSTTQISSPLLFFR